MSNRILLELLNKSSLAAATMSLFTATASSGASEDLTAGVVMNKMNNDQRFSYVAGIVDTLGHLNYLETKDPTYIRCAKDWFYTNPENWKTIHDTFDRFPDNSPTAIMIALLKQRCGA